MFFWNARIFYFHTYLVAPLENLKFQKKVDQLKAKAEEKLLADNNVKVIRHVQRIYAAKILNFPIIVKRKI